MSGKRVSFIGDAMAAVVQGVEEVRTLLGQPPVVVGGLAVMCRLSRPYRATTDLDVVDRLHASAHAWATDTATEVTITAASSSGPLVEVSTWQQTSHCTSTSG